MKHTKTIPLKGSVCVVLGGLGFIGSALCKSLLRRGAKVIAFDDFSNPVGIDRVENAKGAKVVKGDILDARAVTNVTKESDLVFNVAVRCLLESLEDPVSVQQVNDIGALNVAIACHEHEKRLIHVSSSEIYGNAAKQPINEHALLNPTNPYAGSKAAAEVTIRSFVNCYSLDAVVVRPFNTYGPNMREDSYSAVLPRFVSQTLAGQKLTVHGDGLQTRDHTYIDDTVTGIILAAERIPKGETVNIARGVAVSVLELAKTVVEAINPGSDYRKSIKFDDSRPGDFWRQWADISKARKLLGFSPEVDIEEGVRRYVKWYEAKHTSD